MLAKPRVNSRSIAATSSISWVARSSSDNPRAASLLAVTAGVARGTALVEQPYGRQLGVPLLNQRLVAIEPDLSLTTLSRVLVVTVLLDGLVDKDYRGVGLRCNVACGLRPPNQAWPSARVARRAGPRGDRRFLRRYHPGRAHLGRRLEYVCRARAKHRDGRTLRRNGLHL